MQATTHADVPSSIDYHELAQARAWADAIDARRPWRAGFFAAFVAAIAESPSAATPRILELGSGPGFLAARLLQAFPDASYVGLDFSAPMHALARERLGADMARARLVERSLRDQSWPDGLGSFDFVVTNQAVHELRHKRHARGLHAQVARVLAPGGRYLVCDHFLGEGGMSNDQVYMTVDEQRQALLDAGFREVTCLMRQGDLVLHRAVG